MQIYGEFVETTFVLRPIKIVQAGDFRPNMLSFVLPFLLEQSFLRLVHATVEGKALQRAGEAAGIVQWGQPIGLEVLPAGPEAVLLTMELETDGRESGFSE